MACAYLLTLDVAPTAPRRSLTEKEKAKTRAEQVMDAMPVDEAAAEVIGVPEQSGEDLVKLELANGNPEKSDPAPASESESKETQGPGTPARQDAANSLSHVLELHTSRRMKRPSSPSASRPKSSRSSPASRVRAPSSARSSDVGSHRRSCPRWSLRFTQLWVWRRC